MRCRPSAPPSSWIEPSDGPWRSGDEQQVQPGVRLRRSLHLGRHGALLGNSDAHHRAWRRRHRPPGARHLSLIALTVTLSGSDAVPEIHPKWRNYLWHGGADASFDGYRVGRSLTSCCFIKGCLKRAQQNKAEAAVEYAERLEGRSVWEASNSVEQLLLFFASPGEGDRCSAPQVAKLPLDEITELRVRSFRWISAIKKTKK